MEVWEPSESWQWIHKKSNKSVYELLYIYEELSAYYDSDNPNKVNTWVLEESQKLTEKQKNLFDLAFNEKNNYDGPQYHRPSIFLLDQNWMNNNNYIFVKKGFKSNFFRKSGCDLI